MPTTIEANIMDLLKERTAEHHRRAEQQPLQQALVKGLVTREQYAAWLGQMMHVHGALERLIESSSASEPRLRIVTPDQHGHQRLASDLAALGIMPAAVAASQQTLQAVDAIGEDAAALPVSLLGHHYVLEGSKNGNRFIAMALRRGLGLMPGIGDSYLDPYGEQQRTRWQAFREAMGGQLYTEHETVAIVAAAGAMFDAVSTICAAIR